MADPLSIIGGAGAIMGIIDIVSRTVKSLRDIRAKWSDADLTINQLICQLISLRAALNKISEWISSDLAAMPQHHQLIMDLEESVSCCQVLVKSMDDHISTLDFKGMKDYEKPTLSMRDRWRVVFESNVVSDFQKYIERQTNALTLLLTACNCKAISDQKSLLELPQNRCVFDSVKDDSSSLVVLRDSASHFSRETESTERSSMLSRIFPALDEELMDTVVYQNAAKSMFRRTIRQSKEVLTLTFSTRKWLDKETPVLQAVGRENKLSQALSSALPAVRSGTQGPRRILVTGSLGSGYDTLFLQFKLLDFNFYDANQRLQYKPRILSFVRSGVKILLDSLCDWELIGNDN